MPEFSTLALRHVGGNLAEVDVYDATEDGCLHVRWRNAAGVYVVKVFTRNAVEAGRLFPTKGSRAPLLWSAVNLEEALALWRRMTGREKRVEWKAVWTNGRREWVRI